MQRAIGPIAGLVIVAALVHRAHAAQSFDAPLAHPPLAGPLVLNGGFGEYRSNHFHAGVDLGTGHVDGKPVYAPLSGWIERVRASGVGYGRSIYLHAHDGRLLVFGHLDAYAGALGAWVDSMQNASAQYEQDLWLPTGRFRVSAGEIIAWSGESGAGGPHLHIEIRRGDMAYHPLRAGLTLGDTAAPVIDRVTLEPLDDSSFVAGSAAPLRLEPGARPETLSVIGRMRAAIEAHDARRGVRGMVPWWVALEFGGERVACQFDSISWATDMVESGYVYDDGRITGDHGLVMWAPAGFRPRMLRTSAPADREAGTLVVRPDDGPRTLRLVARGVNGRECVRELVLRPPPRGTSWPDSAAHATATREKREEPRLEFAALPGGYLRIALIGAPPASRRVLFRTSDGAWRWASPADGRWCVVAPAARLGLVSFAGRDAAGATWEHAYTVKADARALAALGGTTFDSVVVVVADSATSRPLPGGQGLFAPAGARMRGWFPETVPLDQPIRIEMDASPEAIAHGAIYRRAGEEWEFVSSTVEKRGAGDVFTGTSHHLGTFTVLCDTTAPRIALLRPSRHAGGVAPYSRWSLRARLTELGSGIETRATRFEVDGKPVPSEWDAEERVLRWRPRKPPARGVHRYVVVACDRARNERRLASRFTVD